MAESSRLPTYRMYTIGWIAALDKELTAALAILDETHQQPEDFEQNDKDSNVYSWGQIGEHNIVIASLSSGSYGLVSAATTATYMATSLPHLRFGLMVGIGAGVPSLEDHDVRLGDIVVSLPSDGNSGVIQYDLGKMGENGQFRRVGALSSPPEVLLKALTKLRAEQRLKDSNIPQILSKAIRDHPKLERSKGKDSAFVYQGAENDRLFEATSVHVSRKSSSQTLAGGAKRRKVSDTQSCSHCDAEREIEREERSTTDPEVHYGTIASGNLVIKDGIFRDQVLERLGTDVLCYDMEAAGLMNNFPCLVIRGICDYADTHKNDRWQNYAALAAAAYAKELLGTIDARRVVLADKMQKIMTEVSDTKQAVQSLNDEKLLDKMYAWLSAPDPSVNYQTALSQRHTGTCEWFLRSEHYERWKMQSASSLWIYGSPGCGKTILSSVIISDLKPFEHDTQHLLFFFFSFTDSKKQSLDGVVRSLTSQLSRKSKSARAYLTSTFSSKYEKSLEQLSTAQICEIFESMLQRSNNIWVVLDALDECQLGSSFKNEGLLPWLQDLLGPKHGNIRTLFTSRREHTIRVALDGCVPEQLCLQGDLVAGDIEAFIDETIANWDGLSIWQDHEWVQEEIRDYLTNNCDGMFRWVSCQLDALAPLQGCRDHEALLATLESLPKSLDGIYARILGQIPEALRAKANRILQFLLYSETPLYLEEIVEIAVFSPKSEKSRRVDNSIKPEKDTISLYCPNLVQCVAVTIDTFPTVSRETLQLAHCSVRDFLLSDRLEHSISRIFQPGLALGSMTGVCLSYLLDIEHDQPLDQILSWYPLAVYAACFWTNYAKQADARIVLGHLQEFIHREDCYKTYCQLLDTQWNERYTPLHRDGWVERAYYRLPYGKRSFVSHSMLDHFARRGIWCAVEDILHKNADAVDADGAYFGNALQEAAFAGRKEVIYLLLGAGANPNGPDDEDGDPLQAAAYEGHQEIVQILLNAGANPNAKGGRYGNALEAAAMFNHHEIVKIFLDAGANPNAEGGDALQTAATHNYQEIVQTLLNAGADPNGQGRKHKSALYEATVFGHQEVMRLLLSVGADPSSIGGYYGSPLVAAIAENRHESIRMLLDAGADPNAYVEDHSGNALCQAASRGDQEVMRMLLDAGADPNAYGEGHSGDALYQAANRGHQEVMRMLLDAGADPNAPPSGQFRHKNSLSAAVAGNHRSAVEILFDWNANIDDDDILWTAASRADEDIIKLLLRKGATFCNRAFWVAFERDLDKEVFEKLLENITLTVSIERRITTALIRACIRGRLDLVQVLLDAGANVDLADGDGNTALYAVAAMGPESMFELFLDKSYAARKRVSIPNGSVQSTSLTDFINLPQLLSMDEALAKRLLGKALSYSSSLSSRETARSLYETCRAYRKAIIRRAPLARALAKEIEWVKKGCDIQVRSMLDEGADPNVKVSGEPSLCYLMLIKDVEDEETLSTLVELLLDYGADATRMSLTYGGAIDIARRGKRWDLVGLIRDKGVVEKTYMDRFMESKIDWELRRLREHG